MAALATVLATGAVLGSFVAGIVGMIAGYERDKFDFRVVKAGYVGGAINLGATALDLLIR